MATLAEGSSISQELLKQTRTIPIVFVAASDPWSREKHGTPRWKFDRIHTNFEFSIGGKWLEMLKQTAPGIKRVLVLRGSDAGNQGFFDAIRPAPRRSMRSPCL
jgi:putative tryptophan/tyrosine transport system substrate-binding protein